MRDHFIKALINLIPEFPNIILITGDLGFGVLNELRNDYPNNFINAGVAEQNMTGIATGMALEGKIVFTYSIANFPTLRCLEQIRNDACYHGVNVNIVSIGGGFSYGALGISHHATEDLSIMRSLPEITVVSPSSFWEVEQATRAIVENDKVCYLRIDKSAGRDLKESGLNVYMCIFRDSCGKKHQQPFIAGAGWTVTQVQNAAIAIFSFSTIELIYRVFVDDIVSNAGIENTKNYHFNVFDPVFNRGNMVQIYQSKIDVADYYQEKFPNLRIEKMVMI